MGGDRDTMTEQLSLAMDTTHNNKAPEIAPNHQISSIPTFQSIQAEIAESLVVDKEQDYLLDILLASTLSIELERPLFMMVQAASSSGKSAYLILFDKCAHFHKLHSLTPRTLFSGHSDAEGGYIPAVMKKKGILCIPDFTTVLSECKSNRNEIFSQLRIAYDGEGGRATGVDVKNIQDRQWRGKLACICAVTGKIELFKSKASDLGERFLYYRHTAVELNAEEMLAWSKKQAALNVRKIQSDIKKLLSQPGLYGAVEAPPHRVGRERPCGGLGRSPHADPVRPPPARLSGGGVARFHRPHRRRQGRQPGRDGAARALRPRLSQRRRATPHGGA